MHRSRKMQNNSSQDVVAADNTKSHSTRFELLFSFSAGTRTPWDAKLRIGMVLNSGGVPDSILISSGRPDIDRKTRFAKKFQTLSNRRTMSPSAASHISQMENPFVVSFTRLYYFQLPKLCCHH